MSFKAFVRSCFLSLLLLPGLSAAPAATGAQESAGSASGPARGARQQGGTADMRLGMLKNYLQAFAAGDAEALKKFFAEHLSEKERDRVPPERMAQNALRFREAMGGGLDLYRVEKNSGDELVALAKSRGEFPVFVRLSWKFDPEKTSLIVARDVRDVETPAEALAPRVSAEELAKELDAKLTRLAAEDKFSGAVLIAKDGRAVWQKAYGYADREAKTPNNVETKFRLGSMNKMITSVAVAQLVQRGKLKYTDTVAQLLPDYPDREAAQKITVHHLLTHTSGLGDFFGPEFAQKKDAIREIRDYVQLFAGKPLRFEPGKGWSYSNAGFIVLGLIVEKVSGQSYYDYVQKNVYDAAGMKSSGSFPKTEKVPNLAVGYTRRGPGAPLTPNWDTLPYRGMSAGGGDSTLGDLLRFAEALRGHKLLSRELTETVITGKVLPDEGEPDSKYAYGFEDYRSGGRRVVGHSGGAPGMNAELDIYLDGGYTVVALSNLNPPAAQQVARYVRERLR